MRIHSVSTVNKNLTTNNKNNFEGHTLIKTLQDPNYSKLKLSVYKLTNGQNVIIVPKKGPDAITVNSVVKTGSFNEPDAKRGISHFMEHLAFDGSKKGSFKKGLKPHEFDALTEGQGASINAHTNTSLTAYFFSIAGATAKVFKDMLQAHAQMIKYPSLPPEAYKKEQDVVIQEIKQSKDSPTNSLFYDSIKETLGINSASSHLVLGEEPTIAEMKRSDVFNYHNLNYTPDNIDTYVVGDVNPEEIIQMIDELFDTPDFQPNKQQRIYEHFTPIQKTKISRTYNEKINEPIMLLNFVGPKNGNQKEQVAANALSIILTEKLQNKLEQENIQGESYTYSPTGGKNDPSLFMIEAQSSSGQEQKALDLISETIKEIKENPISENKLNSIKKNLLNDINKECETTEGISSLLEDFTQFGGVDAYAKQPELIKGLTSKDIQNVAAKYLDTGKTSFTILDSPKHKNNNQISFSGLQFINNKNLTKKVFSNGAKVVFNDNPDTIRSSFIIAIKNDLNKYKAGVTSILALMMKNATKNHNKQELQETINDNAIDLSVDNSSSGIIVSANSMPDSTLKALDIASEILFETNLNKENFNKAKNEFKLSLSNDVPNASSRLNEEVLGKTPYVKSTRLLKNNVDSIKYEEVYQAYKDIMKNPRLTASFTGPLSTEKDLTDKISEKIENIPYNFSTEKINSITPKDIEKTKVLLQVIPKASQSEIIQQYLVNTNDTKTKATKEIISMILGGGLTARLFMDLRETQKLAYQVANYGRSFNNFSTDNFYIKTGTRDENGNITDNIRKSIEGFEKHQKMLADISVTEDELNKAKMLLKTQYIQEYAKSEAQNNSLYNGTFNKNSSTEINDYFEILNNITAEDIKEYAKAYYSKPAVISIVTDKESAKQAEEYLKTKGEYKYYTDWNQNT